MLKCLFFNDHICLLKEEAESWWWGRTRSYCLSHLWFFPSTLNYSLPLEVLLVFSILSYSKTTFCWLFGKEEQRRKNSQTNISECLRQRRPLGLYIPESLGSMCVRTYFEVRQDLGGLRGGWFPKKDGEETFSGKRVIKVTQLVQWSHPAIAGWREHDQQIKPRLAGKSNKVQGGAWEADYEEIPWVQPPLLFCSFLKYLLRKVTNTCKNIENNRKAHVSISSVINNYQSMMNLILCIFSLLPKHR